MCILQGTLPLHFFGAGLSFSMKRRQLAYLTVALGLALARVTQAQSAPTALNLANKGNDYVSVLSKDKIVRIVSDKSAVNLTPEVWHVVYYDPDTPLKCIEVKFGGGQEVDVSHPFHPFQLPASGGEILDKSQLKIDSDRALNIAASQQLVRSLTLKSAKLTLTHSDIGPVWKVQLWAAKLNEPAREADLGTVTVSAEDGAVLKSDLHPGRVQ